METISKENFSRQLYLFLCKVIGSKKVVHARRIFFQVMDNSQNNIKTDETFISSGSKAEGLNMPSSDLDFAVVVKQISVYHTCNMAEYEHYNSCGLLTDTDNAPPGFAYLKDTSGRYADNFLFTLSEYGIILSSKEFREFKERTSQFLPGEFKIHGPCVNPLIVDIDFAYCLKSKTWPKIAEYWLRRPHGSGWPPSIVLKPLAEEGLLYVPIGKKFGVKESHPLQWRISFSIQEKMLIYSFNHTQLLCYALLKLILKEFINTKASVSDLLCSYFMKTTVFWISEEIKIADWKPQNLFRCFKSCIKRLIYWVRLEYCPNYFIPENNMFEGKIYGSKQKDLLVVMERLDEIDRNFISQVPTLTNFDSNNCYDSYNKQSEIERAIYPFLYMFNSYTDGQTVILPYIEHNLTQIRNQSSNLYNSLYFLWLARFSLKALIKMPYKWQCNNKSFYQQYKQFRFYALMGKHFDTVSGWLWVATFMYQHCHYYSVLTITSSILHECTPDMIYIEGTNSPDVDDNLSVGNLTFLEKLKVNCIYPMSGRWENDGVLYNTDLSVKHPMQGIHAGINLIVPIIDAPPIVYLHFLRFMCFHRVINTFERNKCITDIELTIEHDFFIGSYELRISAYFYLRQALQIAKKSNALIRNVQQKIDRELAQLPFLSEFKEQALEFVSGKKAK